VITFEGIYFCVASTVMGSLFLVLDTKKKKKKKEKEKERKNEKKEKKRKIPSFGVLALFYCDLQLNLLANLDTMWFEPFIGLMASFCILTIIVSYGLALHGILLTDSHRSLTISFSLSRC
jgi:protein-S-isoprenylcysteine O-methyltransferase Ste14